MFIHLISPSRVFSAFVMRLHLALSQPQLRHLLRVGESLILQEGRKTLSALSRQCLEAPVISSVCDFFHDSPWSALDVRQAVGMMNIEEVLRRAKEDGCKPILFVSIDDSTTRKDKDTWRLEAVDWVCDHSAGGKGLTAYCKGAVHLTLRVSAGSYSMSFTWRLYLRAKTVRKLNRMRREGQRIRFRTKFTLARQMLEELKEYVPEGWQVFVLFDRWYASAKLIGYIRRQGWHVICAIKSNRKLDGTKLQQWPQRLRNQRYTSVSCSAANGEQTQYLTRRIEGHLRGLRDPVAIVLSHRHTRDKRPKDFLSTDVSLSAEQILKWYSARWPVEVENWYLKQALGLGDFRVHPFEAIQKWYAVVFLVLAFLEWRRYELRKRGLLLESVSEVIRVHRQMHERQVLMAACQEALQSGSVEKAVEHFVGNEIPALGLVS
jgi:hypothetical protein